MTKLKKRRQRSKNRLATLIAVVLVGTMIGIVWLKVSLESSESILDQKTLCPSEGSRNQIAIIIDRSDPFNKVQQKYLERFFEEFKETLQEGDRVSLYLANRSGTETIAPELVICHPGTGEDASALYQNQRMLRERWGKGFNEPLNSAIKGIFEESTSDRSPIMEVIQVVGITAFPDFDGEVSRRIIIISDMLHHTAEYSHYKMLPNIEEFSKLSYSRKVRTDLSGVDVEILYVRRDRSEHLQTKRHALFWADYFKGMGATLHRARMIDG